MMIQKLSELLIAGNRSSFWDPMAATSPRSPLDFKSHSPRTSKRHYYDVGGIGLGIIAALDKSSSLAVSGSESGRSSQEGFEGLEIDSLEEYTYVTCRRGPNKTYTKVYCGDGCELHKNQHEHDGFGFGHVSKVAPGRSTEALPEYPSLDFLSSCHLCNKKLHGKDIYMYRGEKGFCSGECRSMHIMKEERKEQCGSDVSRSVDPMSSSYAGGQIFSTGIFVF